MEIEVEQIDSTQPPKEGIETTPVAYLAIANEFGVENPNKEESNKLMEIWEHGKSLSKTGEIHDIMWEIMHLSRTLGAPRLGESRLDRIYRYAKLKRQEKSIQEELRRV